MAADILQRIVADRRRRIAGACRGDGAVDTLSGDGQSGSGSVRHGGGYTQGMELPSGRPAELPVVPFPGPVICEIKRRSPSRGAIAADLDPVGRAASYRQAGAGSVSVLTEEDYFSGSLADMVAVKRAFPDLSVLRKDFLLDETDVEVSWRAGADAILLIAAILSRDELDRMARNARDLGLATLVEIHNRQELEKIRPLKPALLGINSRDLRTFRVDLLEPLALAAGVDWPCRLVFESGVFHREDVRLVREAGFSSILVGESVVREPERVGMLVDEMGASGSGVPAGSPPGQESLSGQEGPTRQSAPEYFWSFIARRRTDRSGNGDIGSGNSGDAASRRPLVKICGICNVQDALLARDLGADVLGLVYATSPRTAPAGLARRLREAGVGLPLVGVVLEGPLGGPEHPTRRRRTGTGQTDPRSTDPHRTGGAPGNEELLAEAQADLKAGLLSALQLHGGSDPEVASHYGWPVYTAVRFSSPGEVPGFLERLRTPRFLVDAFDPKAPGGTGRVVEGEILQVVREELQRRPHGELWLAGGLNPETVAQAVLTWQPELVDASSGLELEPGKKDLLKMKRFFAALNGENPDGAIEAAAQRK